MKCSADPNSCPLPTSLSFGPFLLQLHLVSSSERRYPSLKEIYASLENREVKGTLLDTYVAAEYKELSNSDIVRVKKILDRSHTYGIVLAGETKKLQELFHDYLVLHAAEISKDIASKTSELKVG